MKLPIYQVDAFADRPFSGNPAAVVPLSEWLTDQQMQAIAEENNLAETAFVVDAAEGYRIRWFTPMVEVDLCGHATLAAAHVLFAELGYQQQTLEFASRSGPLLVTRTASGPYQMAFPIEPGVAVKPPLELLAALGLTENECVDCLFNQDYLVVLSTAAAVAELAPDYSRLAKVAARGIIVTSEGEDYDFVCRFFGPAVGINEDPVTGSAFTKLVPYWAQRLAREQFTARQISPRGGDVNCALTADAVLIGGRAITYMRGEIELSPL